MSEKKKKAFLTIWEVLIVGFILLTFAAIVGPKFGAMQRKKAERAAAISADGGVKAASSDGGPP
ncbi:MAG: hypothetical protein AB2A00_23845 [Myxococcota bacterium]